MSLTRQPVGRVLLGTVRLAALVWLSCLALGACGSTRLVQDADARADALAAAHQTRARAAVSGAPVPPALAAAVATAQRAYARETKGSKLRAETVRIAHDQHLLGALARGDLAAARAAAQAQLVSPANHFDHVTRISVVRGGHEVINATVNSDGSFVVAPASRVLGAAGRPLGRLLVSIQDVTGFVKLVHRRTLADVVARGSSGQVRASLPAAAHAALPAAGTVRIAGRGYAVRWFAERGWGGEALGVWVLVPA